MSSSLPGLDLNAIEAWLGDCLPGYSRSAATTVALLAGGRSNVSYVLGQGDRRWVLRRPPFGHAMESAHDMSREFAVLTGLREICFPAPRAHALCVDPSLIGAPFLVMEWVDGLNIPDAAAAQLLDPQAASATCESFVRTLAGLHTADVDGTSLRGLGRPGGFVPRQVRRWSGQWSTTRTCDRPAVDALRDWLLDHVDRVPDWTQATVVHGDYRLDNVLLDPSYDVAAVLDWEMATLGDPLVDLAVTLVYWNESGDTLRRAVPVAESVTSGPGFWSRARLVEEYSVASGRDVDSLDFCLALAAFKLAVIMESIHYRNLQGLQLGAAAEGGGTAMAAAPDALAALGLEVTVRGLAGLSA